MDHYVGGLLKNFFGLRGNDYAPRRIFRSDNFAEVAPDLRRISIDGADNFDGLFFPHQPRNRCADRAHTILNGANFLFHVALRFPFACAHNAQFGFEANPYDNGIPARIQRRTAATVRTVCSSRQRSPNSCGGSGLAREWPQRKSGGFGGGPHARQKNLPPRRFGARPPRPKRGAREMGSWTRGSVAVHSRP